MLDVIRSAMHVRLSWIWIDLHIYIYMYMCLADNCFVAVTVKLEGSSATVATTAFPLISCNVGTEVPFVSAAVRPGTAHKRTTPGFDLLTPSPVHCSVLGLHLFVPNLCALLSHNTNKTIFGYALSLFYPYFYLLYVNICAVSIVYLALLTEDV